MSSSPVSAPAPIRVPPYRLLDAWRGIASLGVVGYHWSGLALRRFPGLEGHWLYAASKWGSLGVQLFFVISGYVIAGAALSILRRGENLRPGEGIKAYTVARARRIYPTYWAGLLLSVLFLLVSSWMASHGIIAPNIFTNFDLGAQSFAYYFSNVTLSMVALRQPFMLDVAWTLCYEVAFYAIVGIALLWALRSRKESHLLIPLHALTAVCLVLNLFRPNAPIFPLDLWPQFGLGVVLYDVISHSADNPARKIARVWAGSIFALTLLFVLVRDVPYGSMGVSSRTQFAVTAFFALFLLLIHRFDEACSKNRLIGFLSWVGLFSYSLYLTHMVSIRVISVVLQKLAPSQSLHYVAFLIAVAFAVGASYIFYLLFEKPFAGQRAKEKPQEAKPEVKDPAEPRTDNTGGKQAVGSPSLPEVAPE